MQAEFVLKKCTGTNAGTETDCSFAPHFLNADLYTSSPENYPVAIPINAMSSPNYSYEVWLALICTAAPLNYVNNVKVYGPGTRPLGDAKLTIYIGTTATGVTPSDNQSSVATTRQDTNYYQPGNALSWPCAQGDNKIELQNERTQYLVMQLKVEDGVTQTGSLGEMVFHITYEES